MNYKKTIEEVKEIILEKSPNSKKINTSELFENIAIAIETWGKACVDQGEIPVCITGFISIDPKSEGGKGKNIIMGNTSEVEFLLKNINQLLCIKNEK